MVKRDFAFRINKIKQLLGGMTARADEVASWGYSADFVAGLSKTYDDLVLLQDERNANIAAGKAATVKQQQLLQEAENQATMVRQSVRSRLPKSDWNQFGFYSGETSRIKNLELPEAPGPISLEG
jgi:hypothetical protein